MKMTLELSDKLSARCSMRKVFMFLCLMVATEGSLAQSLRELQTRSDIVAVVDLTSGNMVLDEIRGCTMAYDGKVIKAFKGTSDAEMVSFRVTQPLFIGWTYLVFITNHKQASEKVDEHRSANESVSESCPESKIRATVAKFGPHLEFPAIFELRLAPPGSGDNEVVTYYAGPPPMLQLFTKGIPHHIIKVNRPFFSEMEAWVDARDLEKRIGEAK